MSCPVDLDLDDYVDGTLSATTTAVVDAHLSSCSRCRALVADLRMLTSEARSLGPIAPPPHVWVALATRIDAERLSAPVHTAPRAPESQRPVAEPWWTGALGWPRLAAGAAFVLLVAALSWTARGPAGVAPGRAGDAGPTASSTVPITPGPGPGDVVGSDEQQLADAIVDLERATTDTRQVLEPAMAAVVTSNLAVLDGAIEASRLALTQQPEDNVAQDSLLDALTQKVELLEDVVALLHEARLTDSTGAGAAMDVNP